jgi:hypothetical protein
VMVAQVGETGSGAGTEIGGIPETYFWVGLGLLGLGGSIWAIHEVTKDHGDEEPVCP